MIYIIAVKQRYVNNDFSKLLNHYKQLTRESEWGHLDNTKH